MVESEGAGGEWGGGAGETCLGTVEGDEDAGRRAGGRLEEG